MFPELDILFSTLFYCGQGIWFNDINSSFVVALRVIAMSIPAVLIVMLSLKCCLDLMLKRQSFRSSVRDLYYLLFIAFIGIAVTIRFFLKSLFNRARPFQIKEFGGNMDFNPLFDINNIYIFDSSFSSTHSACAFFLVALAFIINNKVWKKIIMAAAIIIGFMVSFSRISSGMHFLSDVLFSGLFICAISYLSYLIFYSDVRSNRGKEGFRGNFSKAKRILRRSGARNRDS
ncbi:phosphatase PAP2 family protein [Candidatus Cyrtobacter comes]|uniref:phosphatase PAP2 family protein n=1 Tax=Candidatus Cyrtobacter comes TaxID=675776 RepID=UPI002ACF0180|nr:phosphatase PAP2 family protein [Candidatus Cyrtobacter comes]